MSKMFDDFKALMLKLIAFEANKVGGNVEEKGGKLDRPLRRHEMVVEFVKGEADNGSTTNQMQGDDA